MHIQRNQSEVCSQSLKLKLLLPHSRICAGPVYEEDGRLGGVECRAFLRSQRSRHCVEELRALHKDFNQKHQTAEEQLY